MDKSIGLYLRHKFGWQKQIELAGCGQTKRKLYIGFASHDPGHQALIHTLEQGLKQLSASGRLAYWQGIYHINSTDTQKF